MIYFLYIHDAKDNTNNDNNNDNNVNDSNNNDNNDIVYDIMAADELRRLVVNSFGIALILSE